MANINVTWTPLTVDPGDIDSLEVYRCDGVNHLTTEAEFQTALDEVSGGATLASQNLVEVATGLAWNAENIGPAHTIAGTGSEVNYHFCVAAKNQGGYKVGSAAEPSTVANTGAVNVISIS